MESKLTREEIQLLDRVYNLRDYKESILVKEINEKIKDVSGSKTSKEDEQSDIEGTIESLKNRKESLEKEFSVFVDDFKGYDKENYAVLLKELAVTFDPQAIVKEVQEKAPAKIEEVENDINKNNDKLTSLKTDIKNAEIELDELDQKLSSAKNDQENLNKMLEEILAGNRSISVGSIIDHLVAVGFTQKEAEKCGALIAFPGDGGIVLYDESIKVRNDKNIKEVFKEAKEAVKDEPKEEKEVVKEEVKEEIKEEKQEVKEEPEALSSIVTLFEEAKEENPEASTETTPTSSTETSVVDELSLDTSKLASDIIKEINNSSIDLVRSNIAKLNELKIDLYEDPSLLIDLELKAKVDLLVSKEKDLNDIRLNSCVLKISLDILNNEISALKEVGLDIKDLPLRILNNKVDNFITNMKLLNEIGVVLDSKEIAEFSASLWIDKVIFAKNVEVITGSNISLTKANGKSALSILAQATFELENKINLAIENNQKDILRTNPESLAKNMEGIQNRINFLIENSMEYRKEDKYKNIIFMPSTFNKTLGITLDDKLPKAEDTNSTLERLLNYPELINKVAKGNTLNADITKVNSLINRLEADANVTSFAYTLDGVDFSKNKFVNSLKLAISSNLELPDEKLIVAALLYNTRKNEKDITTVLRHFNLV